MFIRSVNDWILVLINSVFDIFKLILEQISEWTLCLRPIQHDKCQPKQTKKHCLFQPTECSTIVCLFRPDSPGIHSGTWFSLFTATGAISLASLHHGSHPLLLGDLWHSYRAATVLYTNTLKHEVLAFIGREARFCPNSAPGRPLGSTEQTFLIM